jgi:hypothetical protein
MSGIENNIAMLVRAVAFCARKHHDQRREDAEASPYINHSIGLAKAKQNSRTPLTGSAPTKKVTAAMIDIRLSIIAEPGLSHDSFGNYLAAHAAHRAHGNFDPLLARGENAQHHDFAVGWKLTGGPDVRGNRVTA